MYLAVQIVRLQTPMIKNNKSKDKCIGDLQMIRNGKCEVTRIQII
jgi:hypothetical protein